MGSWSMDRQIAGGQSITINFSKQGPVPGEDAAVRLFDPNLQINRRNLKVVRYLFRFVEKTGKRPLEVKVEDVSDDQPYTWVLDRHPQVQNGTWAWLTPAFSPKSAKLAWIQEIDDSVRVFRFTIRQNDGTTDVLYAGANFPAYEKQFLRIQFGLEAMPKPA